MGKIEEKVADIVWPNWRNLENYNQAKVFEQVHQICQLLMNQDRIEEVKKFRKKSVIVEAEQFIAEKHEPEGLCWELGHGCNCPHIHTLEGIHIVSDGDWIITGVEGEKYPCKPDIFEMAYEPVYQPLDLTNPREVEKYIQGIEKAHKKAASSTLRFGEELRERLILRRRFHEDSL